jgi:CRISPR system Cascade subunit CasC
MTQNQQPPRFLQIHTLTSYSASLLNRDDAGFAKRMPFGGAVRTRISSQCLKRHWRVFDGDYSLAGLNEPDSVRSRISFETFVVQPLKKEHVPEEVARAVAHKIIGVLFGGEEKQKKMEEKQKQAEQRQKKAEKLETSGASKATAGSSTGAAENAVTDQVTVLGRPELDYLCKLAREAIREAGGTGATKEKAVAEIEKRMKDRKLKENLQSLKLGAGLGAALFGRMVTGDILARVDAAIHVAHAMTVHGQLTESDYFSAIDELLREEGEQGSGHINASELTSGLFYGYVVVDIGGLVRNLGGDPGLAGDVAKSLVHTSATVSPGAKRGSTAPYSYSHLVLLESGRTQPRSLANAYLEPVSTEGNVALNAYRALAGFLADFQKVYGNGEQRVHAGIGTDKVFFKKDGEQPVSDAVLGGRSQTLQQVAEWAKTQVKQWRS